MQLLWYIWLWAGKNWPVVKKLISTWEDCIFSVTILSCRLYITDTNRMTSHSKYYIAFIAVLFYHRGVFQRQFVVCRPLRHFIGAPSLIKISTPKLYCYFRNYCYSSYSYSSWVLLPLNKMKQHFPKCFQYNPGVPSESFHDINIFSAPVYSQLCRLLGCRSFHTQLSLLYQTEIFREDV
jgi:hypothetical protein